MELCYMNELINDSQKKASEAVKVLLEKQGINVKLYDVRDSASITDFYVVVTGRSLTHVASLADDLVELLGAKEIYAERVEGKRGNSWILIDYLDVIVNIFDKEARDFYNFERLMIPESEIDISNLRYEVDCKYEIN